MNPFDRIYLDGAAYIVAGQHKSWRRASAEAKAKGWRWTYLHGRGYLVLAPVDPHTGTIAREETPTTAARPQERT